MLQTGPVREALASMGMLFVAAVAVSFAACGDATTGPREVVIDWLSASTVAEAERHLAAAARDDMASFRKNAPAEAAPAVRLVEQALVPGPALKRYNYSVTPAGRPTDVVAFGLNFDALTLQDLEAMGELGQDPLLYGERLEIAIGEEVISGDTARVPLRVTVHVDDQEDGAVHLIREDGAWRIAEVDFGRRHHPPRFDTPGISRAILESQRDSNQDAVARSALRALRSAQISFEIYNQFPGPVECLVQGSACISNGPAMPFLNSETLEVPGYTGTFHAGPPPPAAALRQAGASPRSLQSWAYTFVPVAEGSRQPSFCADSVRDDVCTLSRQEALALEGAVCPASCEPVR
jgi:hypothetical protein